MVSKEEINLEELIGIKLFVILWCLEVILIELFSFRFILRARGDLTTRDGATMPIK